jgi:flavin-dependent dehydrogenase
LLSLTPLEKIPGAFSRLIPTYHVERTSMNAQVARMSIDAGAQRIAGASVENVELGERDHVVHYALGAEPKQLRCGWVLDCSGRRSFLGRQLGITRPVKTLDTASVWNRFRGVNDDKRFWATFRNVDRRRHTIHMTGPGFWIWWIHQRDDLTSVGISFDKAQHAPDVKGEDHGFWEMMAKFPPVLEALRGATPLEPYQYYAHLPYRSDHFVSQKGYAMVGDAAWFVDALYSIGIETACRQLTALAPLIVRACREQKVCARTVDKLNLEFDYTQTAVIELNAFKYKEAWGRPHTVMQTALYELGEIAELYHMQDKRRWRPSVTDKHYRLQWGCPIRLAKLRSFQREALADGERDLEDGALLQKALLPGWAVYGITWPLWKLPNARPWFFQLTRAWGFVERAAQRWRLLPDGLTWMASRPTLTSVIQRIEETRERRSAAGV